MALVLGIDGGGSKTLMCLADRNGRILLSILGAGTNPMDNRDWLKNLAAVLQPAVSRLGEIEFAVLGLGGQGEIPRLDAEVAHGIASLLPGLPHRIENDVYLAQEAAFLGEAGILLIAGTGSMAVVRNQEGEVSRVGGWGDLVGDEGSGFWIGREALAKTTQALDGRSQARVFAEAILAELPTAPSGADAIFNWLAGLGHARSEIAALTPAVARVAETGNPDAIALLSAATGHLAAHVTAAQKASGSKEPLGWSAYGGLLKIGVIVRDLEARLGPMTAPRLPPVGGALWQAARQAGWAGDAHWVDTLARSLALTTAVPAASAQPAILGQKNPA